MRLNAQIGANLLFLECDAKFEAAAESLLSTLDKLDKRGPALRDGSKIQFGWSVLTLRSEDQQLRACEPDFDGDPFTGLSPALDTTFDVLQQQVAVLRQTGAQGVDARFDQIAVPAKGALKAEGIFLVREQPESALDSGWRIDELQRIESPTISTEFESLRVYELRKYRPAVMQLLSLPPGYTAILVGERVDSIARL